MTGMPYPIDGVQEGDRALLAQMTREQLTIAAAQVNLHHKQLQRSILGMGADQELLNKRSFLSRSQAELDKSLASNPQLATPFLRVESWIKSALAGDGSALRALQGVAGATLAKQAEVELGERPQINSPPEPFANAIEGLGSSVATPVAKPLYQHHYRPDGSVDKSSVQYRAEGQRIESNFDDGATVAAMLDLAARSGWTAIKTRGSTVFRQAVFIEAMARGIQVFGYNPTNAELAEGLQRAEARGNATAAHRSPEAQAFIEAKSQEERKRTAATYPELGKAFVLLASAEKWASSVLRPQDAATFTERIRNNIAQDLDSGIKLPAIQLRETQLAARSAQAR